MVQIVERISLEEVRAAQPAMIYYATSTCWWTHDPEHLGRHPENGLPCDPRGSMLFETDDAQDFLKSAIENDEHYGKHGLRAFMAAHHLNCQIVEPGKAPRPWSLREWAEYNAFLDALNAGG